MEQSYGIRQADAHSQLDCHHWKYCRNTCYFHHHTNNIWCRRLLKQSSFVLSSIHLHIILCALNVATFELLTNYYYSLQSMYSNVLLEDHKSSVAMTNLVCYKNRTSAMQ